MGHANVSNLSKFFIRRLYAKGQLSIERCVIALLAKGEVLHASEGNYDEPEMLAYALEEIVNYYVKESWIQPVLYMPDPIDEESRMMLEIVENNEDDLDQLSITADKFEELKDDVNANYLRQMRVWKIWQKNFLDDSADILVFDSIPWQFKMGVRKRYREIPLLSNISN